MTEVAPHSTQGRRSTLGAPPVSPAPRGSRWPSKPIRCIVPLPPGGGTDTIGRRAMQRLSEALGVPVVVENRAGAGGTIGSDVVAKAEPDGYTIGIATASSHSAAPVFRKDLPYDPVKSFTAITMLGTTPYILIGGPAAGATDLAGFIAAAKAKPGKVNCASVGVSTLGYLLTKQFELLAGIEMVDVPYKGSALAYPDLMSGTVAVMLDNPSGSAGLVREGRLTGFAVTRPSPVLPNVPTFESLGVKGFDAVFWYGVVGPAGLPPAIADRIQKALAEGFPDRSGSRVAARHGRRARHVDAGSVCRRHGQADSGFARAGRSSRHQADGIEESVMDGSTTASFKVNELTPDPDVQFDPKVTKSYVTYAHRLAARGLVNSSVGGMVIRVAHPGHEHGVCYAKPQGISLEEVEAEDLVITDIPWGRILRGERATTVGHQMNREILRLRPDVNCVIHLHHDEMIAFMAAGYDTIRSYSLTYGYLMQKPAHYLPASVNVEEDVGPIKTFIQDTNCIIMKRHGFTVLGRSVSEAYHRTCVLVSEIKRNIIVETLCAANGKTPEYISDEELAYMATHGDAVMYPALVKKTA